MRVLVVEDDQKVARAVREGLEDEQYQVVVESTGEGAFFQMSTEVFDLILLDLTLPGRDGLQVLASARQKGVKTPILVLSARGAIDERVAGLDAGADDYLVKPFAFDELLARVRALMRRDVSEVPRLSVGDLTIDRPSRKVLSAGVPIDLTVREFDLLVFLMQHERQVVSRETLARELWRVARSTPLDNVIDVQVARLRKKVDADRPITRIHTVRGVGYMLSDGEP